MPHIEIAEHAGACYGVQRALDIVQDATQAITQPVHTLGPLIHNPQVVAELETHGIHATDTVPASSKGSLVLRTHGVRPEVIKEAQARGLNVIDATCPYVTKAHIAARRLAEEGYQVLVVGEAGHPEVDATSAHAPGSYVVGSLDDLKQIELARRVGIVVQTTQSQALLESIVAQVVAQVDELHVANTICSATSERQQAAASLAKRCDCMIVIGGKNSANTTRLAEICECLCEHSYHIEAVEELDAAWFSHVEHIGVTAGASTPTSQITDVVNKIASFADNTSIASAHAGKEALCQDQ